MVRMRYLRDLTLLRGEMHVLSQVMSLSLSQSIGHGFYFPCNSSCKKYGKTRRFILMAPQRLLNSVPDACLGSSVYHL